MGRAPVGVPPAASARVAASARGRAGAGGRAARRVTGGARGRRGGPGCRPPRPGAARGRPGWRRRRSRRRAGRRRAAVTVDRGGPRAAGRTRGRRHGPWRRRGGGRPGPRGAGAPPRGRARCVTARPTDGRRPRTRVRVPRRPPPAGWRAGAGRRRVRRGPDRRRGRGAVRDRRGRSGRPTGAAWSGRVRVRRSGGAGRRGWAVRPTTRAAPCVACSGRGSARPCVRSSLRSFPGGYARVTRGGRHRSARVGRGFAAATCGAVSRGRPGRCAGAQPASGGGVRRHSATAAAATYPRPPPGGVPLRAGRQEPCGQLPRYSSMVRLGRGSGHRNCS